MAFKGGYKSADGAAGDHVVQIVHNNSGGLDFCLLLGEWIDGTDVTFLSTPE